MQKAPVPRRAPTLSVPPFCSPRKPLFIIAVLLATTILGCSTREPSPPPNIEATIQARMQATRTVENSIKATVEAKKPIAQAVQATLEARSQVDPTPLPYMAIADQNCDELLQEHLAHETDATDAYTMQGVIQQIQTATENCSATLWNPTIVDPQPHETGTCLDLIHGLDPSRLPPGLLNIDGTAPRPTSSRDSANNVIAYWSQATREKPSDLSNCWVYLSDTNSWMTGQDIRRKTATVSQIDPRQGDCLILAQGQAHADIEAAKVPCESQWTHRVVSLFDATDPGYYPSTEDITRQALLNCAPSTTINSFPLKPSWDAGKRTIVCLQDSFGLSLSDPSKLDRMVRVATLDPSHCFNEAPESSYIQVELVDCSGYWQFRVLHTFETTHFTAYPGENLLYQESTRKCDRKTTVPYIPDQDSWEIGYRTTHCAQYNPSYESGTPEILDRLIDPYRLTQGECFTEYATVDVYLAELIPCPGEWGYKVLLTHQYPPSSPYPGDAEILQKATDLCSAEGAWLTPDHDLWTHGYRAIICLTNGTAHPESTPTRPEPTPSANTALDQGINLAEAGQFQEALAALRTAQRLFGGTSAETETWLAIVQESLGDLPSAIAHHSNAIALEDTPFRRLGRAYAFLASDDCASAETDARAALGKPPEATPGFHTHVEANLILALCLTDERTALSHATNAHRGARIQSYSRTDLDDIATLIEELEQSIETSSRIAPSSPKTSDLSNIPNGRWLAQSYPGIATKLAALPWVADELSQPEKELVEQLLYLYVENTTAAAISLLDMPFLQAVTPGDLQAVTSLKEIGRDDAASLQRILSHPTFSQHGITDAWTPIVATLKSANSYNQALVPILLDPAQTHMESRTIQTPLSGQVALHIIRTTSHYNTESINHLEHAVRNAEAFMHEPFPTNMIALLYADAVKGSYAGHNAGTGMVILPKYDVPDHEYSQKITDHEVAHYYWSGNEQWVNEGMAEFMASTFLAHRQGTRILPDNRPCHQYRTISQIPKTEATHRCSYSLGERLFIDLHDTVGHDQFRATMSAFYRDTLTQGFTIGQSDVKKGINHLRSHFPAPAAQQVIDRWYDGSSPYRTDLYDEDPVDPRLSVLNASISEATLSINDRPVSSFSVRSTSQPVKLSIKYQHPIPVGKAGHIPITVTIFYQDGHPYYTKNSELEAQARTIGAGIWYPLWQPGDPPMATGDHVAYVYEAGNKVAQIHWTVTP